MELQLEMPHYRERIQGGLLGLLVGDAIGVPYEFHNAHNIPSSREIEFEPPQRFQRAHVGTPPGTWSDDGALALCLLESLLNNDMLDPEDLGSRWVDWYERGHLAVDGRVFDVGVQTAKSLAAIKAGVPALEAGSSDQYSQGNGSLMRVLPLVLWHKGSDAELVRDAHLQSKVTHGHLVCQVCCAQYCLWARYALCEHVNPWNEALTALRDIYQDAPSYRDIFDDIFRLDAHRVVRGSGFVIDSLFSAKWAVEQGDYETVVRAAISLGNDTDTTACIAGGVAGVRDGVGTIPARWRDALRGQDLLAPLLKQLVTNQCNQ